MGEILSILHISDLHRSKGCEISNDALLSSLLNDKERYSTNEKPKIKTPDIIVVSGDIIRGSTLQDGSEEEVAQQYAEALNFLNELTDQFLNGEKERLVIIPGNHDIDWKFSRESMSKIDSTEIFDGSNNVKSKYLKDAINEHSKIRWSWRDLSFYQINDEEKYTKRLEAFSNFYSLLYNGGRSFSLDCREQFDIFDFPRYGTTIVGFSSCYNNDHLRLVGDIHPDCLARATNQLRTYRKKGRLILSTWHHNTKGLPYDSTYMDNRKLKNFINSGISVGFHGHQHRTELIHEYSDVIEQERIIVFSAGTLCGGPNELPVGNNRQYNVVEIDFQGVQDSPIQITLYVREKTDSSPLNNPIWKAGRIDSNLVSSHTVSIKRPPKQDSGDAILEVEALMKKSEYEPAKKQLLSLDTQDEFVRKFLNECIIQTEDFDLALEVLSNPNTDGELITLLNAAIQKNDNNKKKEILIVANRLGSIDPTVQELTKKLEAVIK